MRDEERNQESLRELERVHYRLERNRDWERKIEIKSWWYSLSHWIDQYLKSYLLYFSVMWANKIHSLLAYAYWLSWVSEMYNKTVFSNILIMGEDTAFRWKDFSITWGNSLVSDEFIT